MTQTKNKVLVIAGMHRSGTSLITQWLYRCGLNVGERLLAKDIANKDGYFEDLDFVDMHREILRSKRLSSTGLTDKIPSLKKQKELISFENLIRIKNQKHKEWGWKDPRTCLFLDVYKELLPDACYIFIVRDYHETVSSLILRTYHNSVKKYAAKKGISKWIWDYCKQPWRMEKLCRKYTEYYLKVWIRYNEELEKMIGELTPQNYLVIHPASMMENDEWFFSIIKKDWQFDIDYVPFSEIYKPAMWKSMLPMENYIKDKSLLHKANALLNRMKTCSLVCLGYLVWNDLPTLLA